MDEIERGVNVPPTIVFYPPGRSKDVVGNEVENFEIAQRLIAAMDKGESVVIPNGEGWKINGGNYCDSSGTPAT